MNQTSGTAISANAPASAGAGSLVFGRSQSAAQGYYSTPQPEQAAGQHSVVFSRSSSQPQNMVSVEQEEPAKEEDTGLKGPVWRLKNAFLKSENVISTWMTLGFIKGWADKSFGAWGVESPLDKMSDKLGIDKLTAKLPTLPGHDKITALTYGKDFDKSKLTSASNTKPVGIAEKTMATAVTAALLQNMAFFMTARGGEIPEGDNMFQRTVNAIRHPDKHSVHFSSATISGLIGVMGVCRTVMGIKGIQNDPESVKKNVSLLVSGICGLIATPLVFGGMFRMDKDEMAKEAQTNEAIAAKEAESMEAGEKIFADKKDGIAAAKQSMTKGLVSSLAPTHLAEMWKYALKNDKMGLLGRALSVAVEAGFVFSGRAELQQDPTNQSAYKTVKGGMTGLALTFMQAHFVYDRLLTNSKGEGASR